MTRASSDAPEPAPDDVEAFALELERATKRESALEIPPRYVDGRLVVWSPQPGSQEEFLSCPLFEALYHGTRGPGKTDGLLMDFAQHVGQGHGAAWRGVLFRQTYPQLADVVAKSQRWFRQIFPSARFVHSGSSGMSWHFETGEALLFRQMRSPEDYWNHHGHEYPWIAFEELTNWPDDRCYKMMISCCRSSSPNVPRKLRATTNPYGVGHEWVKQRFGLHGQWWTTIVQPNPKDDDGNSEPARCAIHGHLSENKILLAVDPDYPRKIAAAASNKAMAQAWLDGRWDIVAGGMFSDVWSPTHNIVPRFQVPPAWRIDRAFDWGSTKPFSVGWYAKSDGDDLRFLDGRRMSTVRGDLFRVREWYGSSGRPNEGLRIFATDVATGIVERELAWRWRSGDTCRVVSGVADSAIFTVEDGASIAGNMQRPVRVGGALYRGITWKPSDKGPGSRKNGWELVRKRIAAARPKPGLPREDPALFVVGEECPHFLRTVLSLPRDPKDLDDIDTNAEDHIADEVRYRIRAEGLATGSTKTTGGW